MEDKINVIKVANTLAFTVAIIYLICIIAVWIAPEFTMAIGNYLLHGVDISDSIVERSLGYSLISLILGAIVGWLIGALFAFTYNRLR